MFREARGSHEIIGVVPEKPWTDLVQAMTTSGLSYHFAPFKRPERTLSPVDLARTGVTFLKLAHRLSSLIRQHRVDIVHTANLYDLPFCAAAAKLHRVPVLWLIENPERFDRFNKTVVNACSTDAIVGTSNQILREAHNAGVRSKVTAAIGNPYDDALFFAPEGHVVAAGSPLVIGFAGVFSDRKGTLELCRAYKNISDRLKHTNQQRSELHLAGSGDANYTEIVKSFVRDAGLAGEVRFLGNLSRAQMRGFYQSLDLYIMLSKREGLSVAMLEAMASGAPSAILSPWGDDVIIDGTTGVRLNADDAQAVSDAVWPLVGDPALRRRIGAAGAQHVKANFSPAAVGGRLVEIYETVTSRNGSGN
jgi:glycosyltransferase involved in cell wall biosynthesis